MNIIIKRYTNRKQYDTHSKRYISLEGIEKLIKDGHEVKVIDNQTGNDITPIILSQVIYEIVKRRSGFLPTKVLLSLILAGGKRIDEFRHSIFNSLNLFHHFDVEIEKRINRLITRGEMSQGEGFEILDKLLTVGKIGDDGDDDIDGSVVDYLRQKQLPTMFDLEIITRRIESINNRITQFKEGPIN
jgi:polyhydroxyalkanoate synthesis repressor PhaR